MLTLAVVAGWGARWHWALELTTHLQLHLALASIGLLIAATIQRRSHAAGGALLCLAVSGTPVARLETGGGAEVTEGPSLRLVGFNVHTDNPDPAALRQFVDEAAANVVFLYEVSPSLLRELERLAPAKTVVVAKPRLDNFGIAAITTGPAEARLIESGTPGIRFAEVRLERGGRSWSLLGVHPLPPLGAEMSRRRNRSLKRIADWVSQQRGPYVVIGDLNLTPFSPHFDDLLAAGLRNSQRGFGYAGTWPADLPSLLRIPIDHALVGDGVVVVDRRVGPSLGSDHLALAIEVAAGRDASSARQ
ncbi:MAG: endonuclease/exonuclease/phosphatase family protein [Myxococcota bacterium]